MSIVACCVPVSPIRAAPAHASEMVTQLLFGETAVTLAEEREWIKIKGTYDGYEGWCHSNHLLQLNQLIPAPAFPPRYAGDWVNEAWYDGVPMHLPFGCDLSLFLDQLCFKTIIPFTFNGKFFTLPSGSSFSDKVTGTSKCFLNTGYLWGGKSVFGIDCSGFTQTVFRLLGIAIHRDASQQATQGEVVDSFQEVKTGDLAFFDNDAGKITHVGILTGPSSIIHASGKVRIDKMDEKGILHSQTGEQTHRLRVIKRFCETT